LSVYAQDKTLLGQAETLLNIVAPAAPEKPAHILCIGDSLTAGGQWPHEAHRRLTETGGQPTGLGFNNLHFIGTCEKDGVLFEGYGGWLWENYLSAASGAIWVSCTHDKTTIDQHSLWQDEAGSLWQLETLENTRLKLTRYQQHTGPIPVSGMLTHAANAAHKAPIRIDSTATEPLNPFYNSQTNAIDFAGYCAKNRFPGIDAAYILLGWNGLIGVTCPIPKHCQHLVAEGKKLVDALHVAYPKAPVRIMGLQVPSVKGGTAASYGASLPYCDDYGLTRYVMELNMAYEAWTQEPAYRDFMEFINISGQFDTDYNMPSAEKPVNVRNAQTEIVDTNGVHPKMEGYLQIADAAYRNMVKTFCSQK
ncbi:MAG: hypothetical protein ACI4QW_06320, partial [Clostridia bacterium]